MSAEELEAEREYLGRARAELGRMLDTARMRVATGAAIAGDGYSAETLGRMLRGQVKELTEEPDSPVSFGRVTFDEAESVDAGDHSGQCYYFGRRHITDEAGLALVIDWRAPVARVFYRAGRYERYGVAARRRYGWTTAADGAPLLTGFEDEHLARASTGNGFLARELERPRVGPMRDIVATIQPDQDELVRAELTESVCVQGAPGTGKTAVGLHRAAYLLYTHRQRLRRGGVLVVGPNPAFLRYIGSVLPALGEVDVEQVTLDELLTVHSGVLDGPAAAAVKHDPRMAVVLRRALESRMRAPTGPLVVPDDSYRWRIPVEVLARLVAEVRADGLPHAIGRERLRSRVVARVQRHAERRGEVSRAWVQRMSRAPAVREFLELVWPVVRPAELVAELLGDPAALAAAADGVLTAAEQAAIAWPRPRRARSARWTPADAVLIDEVAGLVARPPGYVHIIVDEAQDLSPMQCRALARRSEHGSLTVLGDLAQGTTPWAATDWATQLAHLGQPKATLTALTAGFRIPAVVATLANWVLDALAVPVPPTHSVRADGELRVRPAIDLTESTVEAVRAALGHEGSIAVIAADARTDALAAALTRAGIAVSGVDGVGRVARVTALPASLAKGLEYDHVVVVEPAEIVAAEVRGLHRLYVVLTRAVSRLDIVHQEPLPPALRDADRFSAGSSGGTGPAVPPRPPSPRW